MNCVVYYHKKDYTDTIKTYYYWENRQFGWVVWAYLHIIQPKVENSPYCWYIYIYIASYRYIGIDLDIGIHLDT